MRQPIKILNISSGDLIGSRFNGYDWIEPLKKFNIESTMLVAWNHHSKSKNVQLLSKKLKTGNNRNLARAEYLKLQEIGKENVNYSWCKDLFRHPWYLNSDLIHLQIVQDGTLDINTIRRIIDEKPTVWTWHDPWPLTGHCVYPMNCTNFKLDCDKCPDLDRPFKVANDFVKMNRQYKKEILGKSYTLHVASKWFKNFININQDGSHPAPTYLPFGLSSERFSKINNKEHIKNLMGIPKDYFVIGVRAVKEAQKNFDLVKRMMQHLNPNLKIVIVTIQEKKILQSYSPNHRIMEFGWTNSDQELSNFYNALDLFLMPSMYETFGFMALEAILNDVPVIYTIGTSVDEIINIGKSELGVSGKSASELAEKIEYVINNYNSVIQNFNVNSERIKANYNLDKFLENLREMYTMEIRRFKNANN